MFFRYFSRICFCLLLVATSTHAKTWPEAIEDVRLLAEAYQERANWLLEKENPQAGGSALSYFFGMSAGRIDSELHFCAILGRRLGRIEFIRHLEEPLPPLTSDVATLAWTAASLSNWISSAERFSNMTQEQRAHYWNLECVGRHEIPEHSYDGRSDGTVFYTADGANLWVYGEIVDGFSERLVEALDSNPQVQTVGLGSGGGAVFEAILAGNEIRVRGLSTQIVGPCYSACPLVFLGGVHRTSLRPWPPLGFHQVYSQLDGRLVVASLDDPVYRYLAHYIDRMGADASWVILQMASAGPLEMSILGDEREERDALCTHSVVTFFNGAGSNVC